MQPLAPATGSFHMSHGRLTRPRMLTSHISLTVGGVVELRNLRILRPHWLMVTFAFIPLVQPLFNCSMILLLCD